MKQAYLLATVSMLIIIILGNVNIVSSSAQIENNLTWIEYRDSNDGFGFAIPSNWNVYPASGNGNFKNTIVTNFSDTFVTENSESNVFEMGAIKIDFYVIQGIDQNLSLSDAVIPLIEGELNKIIKIDEQIVNSHQSISVFSQRKEINSNEISETIAFRLSPDKVLLVLIIPSDYSNNIDIQNIINSIVLSSDESIEIPSSTPSSLLTGNQMLRTSNESAALVIHPCDFRDDVGDSPIQLFMPFSEGTTWTVGGGGSYYSDYAHTTLNNDYFATDWNKTSSGVNNEDLGEFVYPIASGEVVFAGIDPSTVNNPTEGYGNYVMIEHEGNISSRYAHLSSIASNISIGSLVDINTIIGQVGTSGNSVESHLHLGFYVNDTSKYDDDRIEPFIEYPSLRPSPMWTTDGWWDLCDSQSRTVSKTIATPTPTTTFTPVTTSTFTPSPTNTSTPIGSEDDWIYLDTWENVGCNSEYSFPAVTAKQFKIKMTQGGGWDNRISFYGLGSSGAAWLANGSWQEVNNQTYDLYVGQERETNIFDPAIVSQQRFSVGCNDGETMTAEVYYRLTHQPTPTLAFYPTTTLTLAPTPVDPITDCVLDFLNALIIIVNHSSGKLMVPIQVIQSTQEVLFDIQLFHRVEDEILSQTPQGEEYIALYYEHSPEIIQILMDNPDLRDEAIAVLQMWEPNLQALVDDQGNTVTITNAQVQAVQTFLNHLSAQASPELQQVIANEQLQQPLDQFIDVNMDVALEYVEDGVSATATPTQTITPTFTQTPSPTSTPTYTNTPLYTATRTATVTRTPTITRTPTVTRTPTSTAIPSATPTPMDFIFADDFESGNLNAWSIKVTGNGDLSISSNSALQGLSGLQALINDTSSIYVTDYSPINDSQYHARFLFDPNSISIPNNNSFAIFTGAGGNGITFRLMLFNESNIYKLQMWVMNDNSAWTASNKVVIIDEPQAIELEFKSSSAIGANNGYTKLWINNILVDTFSNLDNDTRLIGQVSLGAVQSLDTGTSGIIYFDNFVSTRNNYIGP
jgi:hypothetical protein